jgi:colanic acid/amylovoran biosynthesis glycosyltransferase
MKVLFCTNAFETVSNGPAKFSQLLLKEASSCGFEVQILTEDISCDQENVHKLELNIPRPFKLISQFIRMWKYYKASMIIRKEYKFDVVVYNNAFIGLLSRLLFKPTVGMINDYCNAIHSIGNLLNGSVEFNKRVVFHYVEFMVCKLMNCIIVNSEYLQDSLSKNYNCNINKFKILYKGIDREVLNIDRKALLLDKVKGSILFVKTDYVQGGLYTLIDAVKLLELPVKLTIVGPAEIHHRHLQELLDNSKIEYEIISYLPPSEIKVKMSRSEIFCVPSVREAFGVANLEALAMGCKVVTSNIGGIPEAVGGNQFAWLVNLGSAEELGEALDTAFRSSLEPKLDDLTKHLNLFSSSSVVSQFKGIVSACY